MRSRTGACCGQRIDSPDTRKRTLNRYERELCLNNINLSKEKSRPVKSGLLHQTYSKKSYDKFIKRSLENVSTNPYGEFEAEQSTLRRSRSLAISREAIFNDLSIPTSSQHRRPQLIPRAKLIDRNGTKERYSTKEREIYQKLNRKCSNISSNYALPRQSHQSDLELYRPRRGDTIENLSDFGLSLPNYYPDSEISLTDLSSDKFSLKEEIKKSKNNAEIFYQDNISFGKTFEEKYFKPRTIRHYTPFENEFNNFYEGKPRSLPNFSLQFEEDSNSYETAIENKIYEELDEIFKSEESKNDSDYAQTHLNFQEINLNNGNVSKSNKSDDFSFENNPIYDEIPYTPDNVTTDKETKEETNQFKTIVVVDEDNNKETQQHGHKYLKEFIESQKGSKKPLQNFLSKKISRAFGENKRNENSVNQYNSLPDLSIGKNLRHCEKIDKKLRKCENANRFIVNIGRHFDVTAESNIPVDFEVKISKVPKLKRSKSIKKEECFIDAVKNLNTTLNGINHQQPEIVENKSPPIKKSGRTKYKKQKESFISENKSEKTKLPRIKEVVEMEAETNKEYQEKLDTIRNYWDKIATENNTKSEPEKEDKSKCKIVDVQTKVEDVIKKFENKEENNVDKQESIVKVAKKIFEVNEKSGKASPIKEKLDIFERNQYESLNPISVEIIENEPMVKSLSNAFETDFDHVRYRVMKSNLFQKNIFANCQKESQFDGLMQYLQHYSFQELLIDNNIVIIEPIRTKVTHETTSTTKSTKTITKILHKSNDSELKESGVRRHFFYHPIRVNKEMNEDELPNPDTVKLVRQLFESGLKKSQSSQGLNKIAKLTKKTVQYQTLDPDKDKCSVSDSNSNPSEIGSNDDDLCCEQYVSEDVLQKIRECGTSVTYYGGKVLNKRSHFAPNPMTETIMNEIEENRECKHKNNNKDCYSGIKFKLLKSNSCSSRIELVGTENLKEFKTKCFNREKHIVDEKNRENLRKNSSIYEQDEKETKEEKNAEKQLTQWGSVTDIKTYNNISINKSNKKSNYDYHNYEKIKVNSKKVGDMEFEPYEIAGS